MAFLKRLYDLSRVSQDVPALYGGYHMLWIAGTVLFAVALCLVLKGCRDRAFRICILAMWGVMLVLEIYKQIFFSVIVVEGVPTFSYCWSNFPFQLCSTPLYVLPFLGILRDGHARDFAAAYTMSFSFIGGIAVYAFPSTVFTKLMIVNVQTMVHHGIQIIAGVLAAVWYRRRLGRGFFFKGFAVFVIVFTVAMLLNTLGRDYLISSGAITEETEFNMFMINPNLQVKAPICEELLRSIPPWTVVVLYFVGVSLVAAGIMWVFREGYYMLKKNYIAKIALFQKST